MKKIYYAGALASVDAGSAGRFVQGKYKPVSDQIAGLLLAKGFKEAADGDNIPADDTIDLEKAATAAQAADKVEIKKKKKEKETPTPPAPGEEAVNG